MEAPTPDRSFVLVIRHAENPIVTNTAIEFARAFATSCGNAYARILDPSQQLSLAALSFVELHRRPRCRFNTVGAHCAPVG